LLAYLVATARPHLRERLCTLLWDGPDDPRAALRWSLTKIRPLLDDATETRLACDRERVAFSAEGIVVDVALLRDELRGGVESTPTETLRQTAARFRGEFLEGLDLAGCYRYHEWCVAEREAVRALRVAILVALTDRLVDAPEEALRYARERVAIDPLAEAAHVAVVKLLGKLGRTREAQQQYESCRRILQAELGARTSNELEQARMALGRAATPGGDETAKAGPETAPLAAVVGSAPSPLREAAPRSAFVGRAQERAALHAQVEAAKAGTAEKLVLVVGDAGIGKSRLLETLEADARAAGGLALRGRAFEAEMVRPYGAWIDALRSANLAEAAAPWAGDLSPLLPELGGKSDDGSNQNRLFDAVTRLLSSLAQRQGPVAVVLDDIQWLDEASAALLHFACRELGGTRVLFACGARRGELGDNRAALKLIRTLERDHRLEQIAVGPLNAAEMAALVRSVRPKVDPARVFADSEGHPLFALEIARTLADQADLGQDAERPLSATLDGLLDERLSQLDDRTRELLPWVAALGHAFKPDLLASICGAAPLDLLPALEDLERHGVLRIAGDGYDFAHDLLRQCAYRQLSEPRRRLVHLQIARVLQAAAASDDTLSGDVAHHAAAGGDDALAARAYVAAGERCLRVFANAEAAELAMRGLQHLPRLDRPSRLKLHLDLLAIYIFSGRAHARLREVDSELLNALMDGQDAGLTAEVVRGFYVRSILQFTGENIDAAQESTWRALEVARAKGDPMGAALQLSDSARCLLLIEREVPQAQSMLAESIQLAGAKAADLMNVSLARGLMHSFLGETDRAIASLQRAFDQAERDQARWEGYTCLVKLISAALDGGQIDLALGQCDRLQEAAAKMFGGSEQQGATALIALVRVAAGQASPETMTAPIDGLRVADAKGMLAYVLNMAAIFDLRAGRREETRARATEALSAATAVGRLSQVAISRALLGQIALLAGDARTAQAHLAATEELRREPLALTALAMQQLAALETLLQQMPVRKPAKSRAGAATSVNPKT
ncbi:MAG TPA: AAA family ATPase, partial [Polyangia bacterium]|nr:AAA family ATPase [Polyangia bacterium]